MENSAEAFSSKSCVPGASPQSVFCSQCITKKCLRNTAERYYGYEGAFLCSKEDAGDGAFIPPPSYFKMCNLARVPAHTVVTRGDYGLQIRVLKDTWLRAQKGLSEALYKSAVYGGKNLFNGKTQGLFAIKEKSTFLDWLRDDYVDIIEGGQC